MCFHDGAFVGAHRGASVDVPVARSTRPHCKARARPRTRLWFSIARAAFQCGTAWAGLRLIHHHQQLQCTLYHAAPQWPAGFPVLVGACQFVTTFGVGGFATAKSILSLSSATSEIATRARAGFFWFHSIWGGMGNRFFFVFLLVFGGVFVFFFSSFSVR